MIWATADGDISPLFLYINLSYSPVGESLRGFCVFAEKFVSDHIFICLREIAGGASPLPYKKVEDVSA